MLNSNLGEAWEERKKHPIFWRGENFSKTTIFSFIIKQFFSSSIFLQTIVFMSVSNLFGLQEFPYPSPQVNK